MRVQVLVKPKIGAWGLNWQHCHRDVLPLAFPTAQYYQAVASVVAVRSDQPVTVDLITTEGQSRVLTPASAKSAQADAMFDQLIARANAALTVGAAKYAPKTVEVPAWMTN